MKQAVSETEAYGPQGDMLSCNDTKEMFNQTEIENIKLMLEDKEHWHQKSRYILTDFTHLMRNFYFSNCQFLLAYHPGQYNHNLDKILRCNSICDREEQLPSPFPMFTEEKAHVNDQMKLSILNYFKCLKDVGVSNSEVGTNLTRVTWKSLEDTKWSTCASLKTFARNCSSILRKCLDREHAELVLAEDFQTMVGLIYGGLRKTMLGDFNITSCDIFGGNVSMACSLNTQFNWILPSFLILNVFLCN